MVTPLDGLPCLYCGRKFQTDDREHFHSHLRLHRKRYYGRNSLYCKWFVTRRNFSSKIAKSPPRIAHAQHKLSSKKRRPTDNRRVSLNRNSRDHASTKCCRSRESKSYHAPNSRLILFDQVDVPNNQDYIDVTFPSNVPIRKERVRQDHDIVGVGNSSDQECNRPADWHHVIQWREFWDKQLKLPVRSKQQMLKAISDDTSPQNSTNDADMEEISKDNDPRPRVDLQVPAPPPLQSLPDDTPLLKGPKTLNAVKNEFVPSVEMLVHKCRYCGEVFSTEDDLMEHEGAHTGNMPYLCLICNARFALVTNFRAHEKAHFTDMIMAKEGNTSEHEKESSTEPCNGRSKDKTLTPQEYTKVGRKPIYPAGSERGFKCEYCGVVKNERRTLIEHIRVHTGERPLSCKYCNMTFAYRGSRNKHQRRHEKKAGTLDESVQCNFCDLKCSDKHSLQEHTKKVHGGDKPFKCRYCGKSFSHKCNVESHERLHTGDKPFSCPMCPATFTQLSQQVSHVRTHTGERPYKCRYCDKDFRTSSVRKNHERTHTGEKPYNCPYCSAAFARRTNLKQHLISHTDVKPKQCQYCGKGLTSNRSLKRHEESHRRKEMKDLEMH